MNYVNYLLDVAYAVDIFSLLIYSTRMTETRIREPETCEKNDFSKKNVFGHQKESPLSLPPQLMNKSMNLHSPQLIVLCYKGLHIFLTLLLQGQELALLQLRQLSVELLCSLVREQLLAGDLARILCAHLLLFLAALQLLPLSLQLVLEAPEAGLLVGHLLGLGCYFVLDVAELLHERVGGRLELCELFLGLFEELFFLLYQITEET